MKTQRRIIVRMPRYRLELLQGGHLDAMPAFRRTAAAAMARAMELAGRPQLAGCVHAASCRVTDTGTGQHVGTAVRAADGGVQWHDASTPDSRAAPQ